MCRRTANPRLQTSTRHRTATSGLPRGVRACYGSTGRVGPGTPQRTALAGNNVFDILEAGADSLWFACGPEGISFFDGSHWRTHEGYSVFSLLKTEDGTVWAASGSDLLRFEDGRWQVVTVGQLTGDATVARWSSGDRIWIWNHRSAKVYLFTPTTSAWTVFTDVPSSSVSETQTSDNLFIFDDEVWLGGSGGAVRYDDETWIKYTSEDGLIDGPITTIVKDRNGALWFAGQHQGKSGAARYDGNSWRIFTESDGLVGDNIANGLAADNGDVWFGTKHRVAGSGGGLMRFDGRSWTVYTTADGLLHDRIYDIGQTPDGVVWFGTFRGLGRFDPDQNQWAGYLPHPESGAPAQKVRTLSATRSVWIGQAAPDAGAAYFDGKSFDWFSIKDGLASDGVWEIFESRDGTVWTGTLQGLSRYDGLTWTSYSDVNSSPASIQFHSIAETTDGTLWMRGSGNTPVVRYVPDRNGPETRLQHAVDRVSSMGNIHLQWTGGDFWNKTPRDQLRYQYRIDDAPWSIASIETAFTFTLLSSGSYRFEVRAIDLDGNADPTPAIHAFIVEAPWWRNPVVAGPGLLIIAFALFQSARVVQANGGYRIRWMRSHRQTTSCSRSTWTFSVSRCWSGCRVRRRGCSRARTSDRLWRPCIAS